MSLVELALNAPVESAAEAARNAAVTEAQRQAWLLLGSSPAPGTSDWKRNTAPVSDWRGNELGNF